MNSNDPWQGRVLSCCAIASDSVRLVELAARIGFDAVWTEMEHAGTDLARAEMSCVAIEAGGAIPVVRAAGWRREHVMHALEIGAHIVVVPMINDAAMARDVVQFGKYAPLGQRGYNTRARGVLYGLKPPAESQREANERTALMVQIETNEAVANLDAILAVKGISGIFIGPGDLSTALGKTGDFQNPELLKVSADCIRKARAAGLHAAMLAAPGPLLTASLEAGADLCVFGSDMTPMLNTWREQLSHWKKG